MDSDRPWRVALTGGIASGKSTVAALFAELGVPVIDLDLIAREVVAPGTALLEQVFARFGSALRRADGELDRRALRELVFRDSGARRALEALLHPAISARAAGQSARARGPYQIVVIPLLAETGAASEYERVLLVDCDEATQRARLAQRDGMSPALVEAALASQVTRAARRALAAEVIDNSGGIDELRPQVHSLHRRYLELAQPRAGESGAVAAP
ncbi:MAG TPA: dephospho-CoA kinase [Steroidobacteraceae bacterium]|nr:dephospho-CoA kinase [Steroidobacteraceae bacterium]